MGYQLDMEDYYETLKLRERSFPQATGQKPPVEVVRVFDDKGELEGEVSPIVAATLNPREP